MCYPHWYGVGDHRIFLLEISAASLFGGEYPSIMRPTSHALTCKIARIRRKYCKTMEKLVNEHNMTDKLNCIEDQAETSSTSVIQRMHDKWDVELGQFMRHSERSCTKLKSCALEYSPTVGQWLKRRSILKWILRWHDGKIRDTRNMCRAARHANIQDPLTMTKVEVQDRLHSCLEHRFELKLQASSLRRKHLQWRLSVAKKRGDDEASTEIL